MAIEVEDGTGLDNAQSYVTVEELDGYYELHLYPPSGWATTTEAQKEAALVMATRLLDSAVEWKGAPVNEQQALGWPRYGVTLIYDAGAQATGVIITGNENITVTGEHLVASNIVPKAVKDATMELSRYLLAADRAVAQDTPAIKRQKVDVLEREYFEGARPDLLPDEVLRLVRRYCLSAPAGGRHGARASAVSVRRA